MKQLTRNAIEKQLNSFQSQIFDYVRAGITGIWVNTSDFVATLNDLAALCNLTRWQNCVWDCDIGIQVPALGGYVPAKQAPDPAQLPDILKAETGPLEAARLPSRWFDKAINDEDDETAANAAAHIVILKNFHLFLDKVSILQATQNSIELSRTLSSALIVLSPVRLIPPELDKDFVVIDFDLPSKPILMERARVIAESNGFEVDFKDEQVISAIESATGLTQCEADSTFSLSLIKTRTCDMSIVWKQKSQMIAKSGLLQIYKGEETLNDLCGLDNVKSFCRQILAAKPTEKVKAKGILCVGTSGAGKSAFAKALGNEAGRPTVSLDIGALMGSLVGQTEARTREALKIIDAMSPAVLFVDECEKALAGIQGSGSTDSGVSARLFGTLLVWLSDHESDIFSVLTANDISKLPPEFSRAERFDGIFFFDLPNPKERAALWTHYVNYFELSDEQTDPMPVSENWTGAEVKACCRMAALTRSPLIEAAKSIIPVATSSKGKIEELRDWADGRCLSASRPGVYSKDFVEPQERRRRLDRNN